MIIPRGNPRAAGPKLSEKELDDFSPTEGHSIPLIPKGGRLMHFRKASVLKT